MGQLYYADFLLWQGLWIDTGPGGPSLCLPASQALQGLLPATWGDSSSIMPRQWCEPCHAPMQVLMLLMAYMVDLRVCAWLALASWGEHGPNTLEQCLCAAADALASAPHAAAWPRVPQASRVVILYAVLLLHQVFLIGR